MAVKKKEADKPVEITFSKEQILASKKYQHMRDVVSVVLVLGESYTLSEVDKLIDKFMKGEVK